MKIVIEDGKEIDFKKINIVNELVPKTRKFRVFKY